MADIRAAMRTHKRVVGVAATGAGKTVCFSYITKGAIARGKRIMIMAHREFILDQIGKALDQFGVRYGFIRQGHSLTTDAVQIAMVQTLGKRLDRIPPPDIAIVDECHHAVSPTYRNIMDSWRDIYWLGVTATPQRLDGRGLGDVFTDMVLGPQTWDLIPQGYLADFRYLAPPKQLDLSGIKTRGGDYALDQLAKATDRATITGDAIGHYREHIRGAPSVAFCCNIAHAEHVAAQFRDAGLPAASIDGSMSGAERRRILDDLARGHIRVLTSCDLISEGFDLPAVSGIILLRASKSLAWYLQAIGRGLRTKPDGGVATILDHVGNIERHGAPAMPRVWTLDSRKRKPDEVHVKTCQVCYRVFDRAEVVECAQATSEPDCLAAPREASGAARSEPETVAGHLVEVAAGGEYRPAWAHGIDLVRARGEEWKALLGYARTKEQLDEIARARGYSGRWAFFVLKTRRQRRAA